MNADDLEQLARVLSIDEFCELVAKMFAIGPDSGEQMVEMSFRAGEFQWARVHSGRIGRDRLGQLRGHSSTEG